MEIHPLAELLPEMSDQEFEALKKSIQESGQRDRVIILDNKILDGRSRAQACAELDIPFRMRPYDTKRDGFFPEQLVLDKNINRRNLTTSQRAAIAADLHERIQEAKKKFAAEEANAPQPTKKTGQEAADEAGVSKRSMEKAKALKKTHPDIFQRMQEGQINLNQAQKEAAEADALGDTTRQELADGLEAHHDEAFIEAVRNAAILGTIEDLKYFHALTVPQQAEIRDMVAKGWSPEKARDTLHQKTTPDTTVQQLINRALSGETKDYLQDTCEGWELTLVKLD